MSAGPGSAISAPVTDALRIAESAVVLGTARLGEGALVAQGAVIRAAGTGVEVGTGSAVLENSVVVGTPRISTTIGRRTTFGHRCKVIGAVVGDLCEIGNASILMPGARVGDRVFSVKGHSSRPGWTCRAMLSPSDSRRASSGRPPMTTSVASLRCVTATCHSRRRLQSPSKNSRSEL